MCDYNPRVSFKDDTPRVIEKMGLGSLRKGPVWDPMSPWPSQSRGTNFLQEDLLPPFSGLTNDEDREKRAELRKAGTYYVIVIPESFADLEEYKAHNVAGSPLYTASNGPDSAHSDPLSFDQTLYNDADRSPNENQTTDDPDVVILRVFEDDMRKNLSPGSIATERRTSRTPTLSVPSSATSISGNEYFRFSYDNTPLMKMASKDGRDHQLIFYYKAFVHRHLAQVRSFSELFPHLLYNGS